MIPKALSHWTLEVVSELLSKGYYESEEFDFKEQLPDVRDDPGKGRLRRTCCAFANSDGGFLVYGVSDDASKSPEDRLVGVDKALDFPVLFGNFPADCQPSIDWTFQNPPLELKRRRVLHIVQIPKSWKAPHATGDADGGWRFMKRTNRGNQGMDVDEIRSAFLGFYEKRLKLQLLRSELVTIKEQARSTFIEDDKELETRHSLVTFSMTVLETVISDTYTMLAEDPTILSTLSSLRQELALANNKIQLLFGIVILPMSNKAQTVRQHNEFMRGKSKRIVDLCEAAIQNLDEILKS